MTERLRIRLQRPLALFLGLASTTALIYLVVAALAAPLPSEAAGSHATNLRQISAGSEDWWWNWDFQNSGIAEATNLDWPTRWLFASNAEVDKVKQALGGCNEPVWPDIQPEKCHSGGKMRMEVFDGNRSAAPFWDDDGGIKSGRICDYDDHMRLYARYPADSDFSTVLGYYVVATNHLDRELGWRCNTTYWSYELHEDFWRDRIDYLTGPAYGWVLWADASNWLNDEPVNRNATEAVGGPPHYVQSNGLTNYVDVP